MHRIALTAVLCALVASGCQTWYASPAGSSSGACTQIQPCTPERAYAVAGNNDIVQLRPGVYQRIVLPAGSKRVVFVGGPDVKVRELDTDADNVAFTNIDFDGNFAVNTVVENGGKALFKDVSIGNVTDEKGLLSGSDATGSRYENVLFHDAVLTTEGVHMECVYSQTPAIQVVNSTFRNCSTMDLMFTRGDWWNQPTYGNGTITGNRFYHPTLGSGWHYYGLLWNGVLGEATGWTVKNNWFETQAVGTPGQNDIGLDIPWVGGVRCGNVESVAGVLGAEWTVPC